MQKTHLTPLRHLCAAVTMAAISIGLAACGGGDATQDNAAPSAQASEPRVEFPSMPTDGARTLAVNDETRLHMLTSSGLLRKYEVVKPDTCVTNCPVVIDLHGFTSSASQEKLFSGVRQAAGADGAITVFPDGIQTSWNAGSGSYGACCGTAQWTRLDDVGFMRTMIAKIKIDYPMADPKRFYFTGISNGCAMSQRMAAEASDIVAAAACTSHYLLTPQTSLPRPVGMTEIHGMQDVLVSYPDSLLYIGAKKNIQRWATMNHCATTPTKTQLTKDSFVEEYPNCAGGVKVKLYSIKSSHITYLNTDGIKMGQVTWDNLKNERLP